MAISYLKNHGGSDWVIDTYDHFLFGNDGQMDKDGDLCTTSGYICESIHQLKPLMFHGKTVSLQNIYIRRQKHDASARSAGPPRYITADDARIQNFDFDVDIYTNMVIQGQVERIKLYLTTIPFMVGSGCFGPREKDGGYFIINGMEKVLINKESRRFDTPLFKCLGPNMFKVEINSFNSPFQISLSNKRITCRLPFLNPNPFSIEVLMRAIGYRDDMCDLFATTNGTHTVPNPDFFDFVEFPESDISVDEAVDILGAKFISDTQGTGAENRRKRIQSVFDTILLPFLQPHEKKDFIITQIQKLVDLCINNQCALILDDNLQEESDPNAIENKQVDTPGLMLRNEFDRALKKNWQDFDKKLAHAYVEYTELKTSKRGLTDAVLQKLTNAFMIFNSMRNKENKISIRIKTFLRSQLNCMSLPRRANWSEAISTVCRISATNVDENSTDDRPRQIHGTYFGYYDIIESQEGEATGRSRDIAIFARVTNAFSVSACRAAVMQLTGTGEYPCFVNRSFVCEKVSFAAAKHLKQSLHVYLSVVFEHNQIHINTTAGRLVRPVWVVEHLPSIPGVPKSLLRQHFDKALKRGWICFLDADEVRLTSIATQYDSIEPFHEYLELAPWCFFGLSASRIPFPQHNNGARNLFGAHVMPQAIGVPFRTIPHHKAMTINNRFDSDQKHWLFYPQRALCTTLAGDVFGNNVAPCGINAIVAILCDHENQEDALTFSRGFIDRGGGRCWSEMSVSDSVSKDEQFGLATKRVDDWNYSKLDVDGIIAVGSTVREKDVIAAKFRRVGKELHDQTSEIWRRKEVGYVDAVVKTIDANGKQMVRVRVRWARIPMEGDKFALRNGQKGVISSILPDEDMPYTANGMRADILMNPLAFVTRKTTGMFYESLSGKASCLSPPPGFIKHGAVGSAHDCTPFADSFDLAEIGRVLNAAGFDEHGSECMFSGRTGEMYQTRVFIGPMYYQRLVHFAESKSYARGTGPRNPQTLQPTQGRNVDGGIQASEMDTKALNAHGASHFLQQQFLLCSDGIQVHICMQCQDVRMMFKERCRVCGSELMHPVITARSFLWFKNMLKAMNIDMKVCIERRLNDLSPIAARDDATQNEHDG